MEDDKKNRSNNPERRNQFKFQKRWFKFLSLR